MAICPNDGEVLLIGEATDPVTEDISYATSVESPLARRSSETGTEAQPPRAAKNVRASTDDDDPTARIGATLGQYRVTGFLGRGGMGCVYEAEHIRLGRRVALKLLRSKHAHRREAVARFFHEARAVNRIRHRNIVDATDFVELDDGTTFIVMELLDGSSMSTLLKQGPINLARAIAILVQICDGLSAAHDQGIVHRDLKPDNVIVVPTGDGVELVKLLDFGVAKLLYQEDDGFGYETAAGAVVGTPAFMSPEQAGGMTVDARADIYSLGAIMYLMFCSRPVFLGHSFGEFVRKHLNEAPVPPRQTPGGSGMDETLERIILRCLAKHPDERFQTITALRDALVSRLAAVDTGIFPSPSGADSDAAPGSLAQIADSAPVTVTSHSLNDTDAQTAPALETAMTLGDLPARPELATTTRRWPIYAALGLAGLAGLGAALIVGGGDSNQTTHPAQVTQARPAAATARGESRAAGEPAPTLTPITVATHSATKLPPARHHVTIRFLSNPSGAAVHAAGSTRKHCDTPCDVTIDPNDGGAADRRDYVLRRSGYRPHNVTIDLRAAPKEVSVTLGHTAADATDATDKPSSGSSKRPSGSHNANNKKPTPGSRKPSPRAPVPASKPASKPPRRQPAGPIAPSQTIDPFANQ